MAGGCLRRLVHVARCQGHKANPEGEHLLFGFLTTEPNDTVAPDEIEMWMIAAAQEPGS
jgi:hypothetical protein